MARARVTVDRIVEEAARIADQDGVDAATPRAIARRLSVRPPSLYKHVRGAEEIRRALALRGTRQMGDSLTQALLGRSGADAVRSLSAAYRDFARAHPGLYAASLSAPGRQDREHQAEAERVLGIVAAALRRYSLDPEAFVHSVRGIRATLHGFVSLELAGGFGLPMSVDESYRRAVESLVGALEGHRARGSEGSGTTR